jgi:hypothetical protein
MVGMTLLFPIQLVGSVWKEQIGRLLQKDHYDRVNGMAWVRTDRGTSQQREVYIQSQTRVYHMMTQRQIEGDETDIGEVLACEYEKLLKQLNELP